MQVTLDLSSGDPNEATLQFRVNRQAFPLIRLMRDLHISADQITGDGFRFGVSLFNPGAEYRLEEYAEEGEETTVDVGQSSPSSGVDGESLEERLRRAVFVVHGSPTSPRDERMREEFIQSMIRDGEAEDYIRRRGGGDGGGGGGFVVGRDGDRIQCPTQ